MGVATLDHRHLVVHKAFPKNERARCDREIRAYQDIPWAAPRMTASGPGWLDVERCTPVLDLSYDQTMKYRKPLRELLQSIHDAGWWHCDVSLTNVVIHPTRGPLLVDWECASAASSSISADLYGARTAGVQGSMWRDHRPEGAWWGGPWPECPGRFWEDAQVTLE